MSVNTWPDTKTTRVLVDLFSKTPSLNSKSSVIKLFASGVSKGIRTGIPVEAVITVPVGLRNQVCEGRGRMGMDAPVGPVYPVSPVYPVYPVYPVEPVGPLTLESWVNVIRVLAMPASTVTVTPGKYWVYDNSTVSFAARITVVLKDDPWKLITEEVRTAVELAGEYDVCIRVSSGCWNVKSKKVLSVNTCPDTRTTTVLDDLFTKTPSLNSRSSLIRLLASGVSKGIRIGVPADAVRVAPVGLRNQVCAGRGRMGMDAPVGPVAPVHSAPVGPGLPAIPVTPVIPLGPVSPRGP